MIRRPPRSRHTDTPFPYTTLCRSLFRQRADIAVVRDGAAHDVLDRGGGEETFLPQAQFLPRWAGIRRIEHTHKAVRADLFLQCAEVVTGVEGIEPDRVERTGRPQAQGIHPLAAPAEIGRAHV